MMFWRYSLSLLMEDNDIFYLFWYILCTEHLIYRVHCLCTIRQCYLNTPLKNVALSHKS